MDDQSTIYYAVAIYVLTVIMLRVNGRVWTKPPKYILETSTNSPSTSQAFLDPYSFSHVLHGVLFYWMFHSLDPSSNFLASFGLECAWEILENSSFIINRYRSATASLDYYGDSILNTTGDLLSMIVGWLIAHHASVTTSCLLTAAIEIGMLLAYKDNLTLNIIMLIAPVQAIKEWQLRK